MIGLLIGLTNLGAAFVGGLQKSYETDCNKEQARRKGERYYIDSYGTTRYIVNDKKCHVDYSPAYLGLVLKDDKGRILEVLETIDDIEKKEPLIDGKYKHIDMKYKANVQRYPKLQHRGCVYRDIITGDVHVLIDFPTPFYYNLTKHCVILDGADEEEVQRLMRIQETYTEEQILRKAI